jgi:hypothetical protein
MDIASGFWSYRIEKLNAKNARRHWYCTTGRNVACASRFATRSDDQIYKINPWYGCHVCPLSLSLSLPPTAYLMLRLMNVFCQKFVLGLKPKLLLAILIFIFSRLTIVSIQSSQPVTLTQYALLHSHNLPGLLILFQGIFTQTISECSCSFCCCLPTSHFACITKLLVMQ